jgi:glycosyltransferase involved in cell wall biosynthesis
VITSHYNPCDLGVPLIQFVADFTFALQLHQALDPASVTLRRWWYGDTRLRRTYLALCERLAPSHPENWKKNITVANSQWTADLLQREFGLVARQVQFPPVPGSFPVVPWDEKEYGFVCVGRVVPEKRMETVIGILHQVRQQGFDIHLHILGGLGASPYAKKVQALAARQRDWVFLDGRVAGKAKRELMARHKFGINGRESEPFGIAVAELVKAGCITFVPKDGGQKEIVDHAALTFENDDDAVRKIVAALQGPLLQRELSEHMRKRSQYLSVERFQATVRTLVAELLAEKNKLRVPATHSSGRFWMGRRLRVTCIIPTVGRRDELRKMLESLAVQSRLPDEVIVVGDDIGDLLSEFRTLRARFIHQPRASAAENRNAGAAASDPTTDLLAFLDDDIVLEPEAFTAMLRFWESGPADLGGASFNWVNHPAMPVPRLKRMALTRMLGLYSGHKGAVARSGFQTTYGYVKADVLGSWLPSGAVVYRKRAFTEYGFDNWFEGYSYLEDLDLSYRISRRYKLAMVSDARINHYPSGTGRLDNYQFGKKEILNRLWFVRKHAELSLGRCYLGLVLRTFLNLWSMVGERDWHRLERVAGNLVGLVASLRPRSAFGLPATPMHAGIPFEGCHEGNDARALTYRRAS